MIGQQIVQVAYVFHSVKHHRLFADTWPWGDPLVTAICLGLLRSDKMPAQGVLTNWRAIVPSFTQRLLSQPVQEVALKKKAVAILVAGIMLLLGVRHVLTTPIFAAPASKS